MQVTGQRQAMVIHGPTRKATRYSTPASATYRTRCKYPNLTWTSCDLDLWPW